MGFVCGKQCKRADALAALVMRLDRAAHLADRVGRGPWVAQRPQDRAFEPRVGVGQHGLRHLRLTARKKVIEAAFAKPGCRTDGSKACPCIAVAAEYLRELGQQVRAFGNLFYHLVQT